MTECTEISFSTRILNDQFQLLVRFVINLRSVYVLLIAMQFVWLCHMTHRLESQAVFILIRLCVADTDPETAQKTFRVVGHQDVYHPMKFPCIFLSLSLHCFSMDQVTPHMFSDTTDFLIDSVTNNAKASVLIPSLDIEYNM